MTALNIAHRGGAGLMPENTLAAFAGAIARGCDGIEFDVQLSADGVPVVHHDFRLMADVARRNGAWLDVPGPRIADLTVTQLQEFDVGRARPGSDYAARHPLLAGVDSQAVPTLTAVASLAAPGSFVLMAELKCDSEDEGADPAALAGAAYDVLKTANALDRTIFVGFDWRALLAVKARDADAVCWFTTDKLKGDARAAIDIIAGAGADGWFPCYLDASAENIAHARNRGLKVGAWTVNDADEMARLSGLDAICTDRPDILVDLRAR